MKIEEALAGVLSRVETEEDRDLVEAIVNDAKALVIAQLTGDDVSAEWTHLQAQTAAMAEVARSAAHDALATWLQQNGAKVLGTVLAAI